MLVKLLTILGISLVGTAGVALGLILSDRPGRAAVATSGGLDFSALAAAVPLPVDTVTLADGFAAQVRHLAGPPGGPLVVLVHGSGWDGGQFDGLAARLAGRATVIAPDLRGHGARPGRRGDIDRPGQFEDDLAQLIGHYARPGQRVVMAGHSSGGGLVIRFAGGAHGALLDGAVLLAPFVQHDAPTARPRSGGWAQPLTRRIVGLSMLNAAGIHALDHLTAIEFAMPQAVLAGPQGHRATTAYSWRLNQSYAPRRDWQADIAALPDFLLIAGAEDEAFVAEAYAPTFRAITGRGDYHLLPGVGHLGVVDDPRTTALIEGMIEGRAGDD